MHPTAFYRRFRPSAPQHSPSSCSNWARSPIASAGSVWHAGVTGKVSTRFLRRSLPTVKTSGSLSERASSSIRNPSRDARGRLSRCWQVGDVSALKRTASVIGGPLQPTALLTRGQVFSEFGISHTKPLTPVPRELHETKEFRVVFCLEIQEEQREESQRALTLETRTVMRIGLCDVLPCPPLVFAHKMMADYDDH